MEKPHAASSDVSLGFSLLSSQTDDVGGFRALSRYAETSDANKDARERYDIQNIPWSLLSGQGLAGVRHWGHTWVG